MVAGDYAGRVERFIDTAFVAAQRLDCVDDGHQASRLHGHTFRLRLFVGGAVDLETGWLIDSADLKARVDAVLARVDHQYLNDVPGLENPSSEGVCHFLAEHLRPALPGLTRIEMWENGRMGVALDLPTTDKNNLSEPAP